jgi:NodT family efflux transporter outer membrane factor (OMF) lipoprotein
MPAFEPSNRNLSLPSTFDQPSVSSRALANDWPKLFRSNELDTLIRQADAGNLDLAGAVARITEADAQTASARAQTLPTLDGSATAQRSATPSTITSTSGPFSTSVSNQFATGLTASYTLDAWGRYRSLQSAAMANAEASVFDRDALALGIAGSTATTYFGILAAKDRIALQKENISLATHILDAIRARVSVGTASALDIAEQESIVASQKAAVPALEQQTAQGLNQLAILLGRPPEGFTIKAVGLKALMVPDIKAGLPSSLLLRRPDIARAEADLRVAEANLQAARAAFLPSFDLTVKGGVESRTLENWLRPDAAFASALGGLTAPIFDGGALDASYALQTGRRSELVAAYRKTVLTALGDVENALVSTKQGRLQEDLQVDVVTASKRAYSISEERLRAGTIDLVTLLTVQQNLFQAEEGLIQSRLSRLQASIALVQALGGGFDAANNAALISRATSPNPIIPVTTP